MPLIVWDDSYSVSIKSIDEHHMRLIEILNNLHKSATKKESRVMLGTILLSLRTYVKSHFLHEETLFEKYNYPDTSAHKKDHEQLIQLINTFYEQFSKSKTNSIEEFLESLKHEFVLHIQKTDMKYSEFLRKKGVV